MSEKRVFIGTSGWTYDDWAGVFSPKEVRGADRLACYATRFDTVEVNATFSRYGGFQCGGSFLHAGTDGQALDQVAQTSQVAF